MKRIVSIILLLSFAFVYIFPQTFPGDYYFSPEERNMLLIRVNVWGNVKSAGSVLVPDGTDVMGAISFANGPSQDANTQSVTLIHADGKREKLNLTKYRNESDRRNNPILKPGDTIVVPASGWFGFTRAVSFIYQVAVIFYTVFQIWNIAETIIP